MTPKRTKRRMRRERGKLTKRLRRFDRPVYADEIEQHERDKFVYLMGGDFIDSPTGRFARIGRKGYLPGYASGGYVRDYHAGEELFGAFHNMALLPGVTVAGSTQHKLDYQPVLAADYGAIERRMLSWHRSPEMVEALTKSVERTHEALDRQVKSLQMACYRDSSGLVDNAETPTAQEPDDK